MSRFIKFTLLALAAFLLLGVSITVNATSLSVGGSFKVLNPDCTARPSCSEFDIASDTQPAWIHTISVTAGFEELGDALCEVRAGVHDVDGGPGGTGKLWFIVEVFATNETPTTSSITLPTPIKLDPLDEVVVDGIINGGGNGECRAEAYFGLRVPPTEED